MNNNIRVESLKRKLTAGIVDYGIGNHGSLENCFKDLDINTVLSNNKEELNVVDFLVLPGVGAFSSAMDSLHKNNLLNFLKREAKQGKLIIGICLGAQLLTESSCEYGYTSGLGIVPGKIIPFSDGKCHIGWNELNNYRSTYDINYKDSYYFNHSLYYQGPDEYVLCKSFFNSSFASVYKKQNVIGLQFHPEKSQISGRIFLKEIINSFFYA